MPKRLRTSREAKISFRSNVPILGTRIRRKSSDFKSIEILLRCVNYFGFVCPELTRYRQFDVLLSVCVLVAQLPERVWHDSPLFVVVNVLGRYVNRHGEQNAENPNANFLPSPCYVSQDYANHEKVHITRQVPRAHHTLKIISFIHNNCFEQEQMAYELNYNKITGKVSEIKDWHTSVSVDTINAIFYTSAAIATKSPDQICHSFYLIP